MNLHRIEGNAEWVDVAPDARNFWQRLAAGSDGLLTIGNFFSALGLIGVLYGLLLIAHDRRYVLGLVVLLAGRLCDLADGWLADRTGTKSPLGETIDSGFDKLAVGMTIVVLAIYGILPWWALVVLVLPHIIISALTLTALFRRRRLHPIRIGKNSMAVAWITLAAYVAAYYVHASKDMNIGLLATLLLVVAGAFGLAAIMSYIREFRSVVRD